MRVFSGLASRARSEPAIPILLHSDTYGIDADPGLFGILSLSVWPEPPRPAECEAGATSEGETQPCTWLPRLDPAILQPFYGYAAALDRRRPSLLRFRPRGAKDWNDPLHPSLPQLATTAACWMPPLPALSSTAADLFETRHPLLQE